MRRIPLEGSTVGDTEVLEYLGNRQYSCRCIKCGETFVASSSGLQRGYNTKCKNIDYLTGKIFGEWTVGEYIKPGKYRCTCSCGKVGIVSKYDLEHGKSTSCGHNRLIDLTGKVIGEWKIIKYIGDKKYLCQCSCGEIKEVYGSSLRNGDSTSCGHDKPQEDLTGRTFGEWYVRKYVGHGKWECQCSCGTISIVGGFQLRNGDSKSCGHKLKLIDLTGKTFGELTVERYLGYGKWLCKCSCGEHTVQSGRMLRNGGGVSCGHIKSLKLSLASRGERTDNQILASKSAKSILEFIPDICECTYLDVSNRLGLRYSTTVKLINSFGLAGLLKQAKPHYKEDELATFIESLVGKENVVRHDRSIIEPKELDIYIPSKKIAIEFNGNYWHSYPLKSEKYHQNKTIDCLRKNVRLIHIFEYEWDNPDKREIIENILRDALTNTSKIYGRNTEVREITNKETIPFIETYHTQGYAKASIHLGLYSDNNLVGVMTLGKPRFNDKYEYEIIRVCFESGKTVVGGLDKLFKYFVDKYNPSSVFTYADMNKFSGNGYLKIGFKVVQNKPITEPNYVWVNAPTSETYSRYQTTKQKLIDAGLESCGNTEEEIMEALGYIKVYDCGSIRLEYVK